MTTDKDIDGKVELAARIVRNLHNVRKAKDVSNGVKIKQYQSILLYIM